MLLSNKAFCVAALSSIFSLQIFGSSLPYRLLDFTPASEVENPVLARVEGTPIEITRSELETFLENELPAGEYLSLTLTEKRKRMEDLIDQYLLLWDAEQRNAYRDDKIRRMLADTRNLLMSEQLFSEEVDGKNPKTVEEAEELASAFIETLFQKAEVRVNQESYDLLLELVKKDDEWAKRYFEYSIDENRRENEEPPARPQIDGETLSHVLAICDDKVTVTIGDCMNAYSAIPVYDRPRLERPEGFQNILKDLFQHHLLYTEAERRDYENHPDVQKLYQKNRNALMKMWAYERLWGEAGDQMEAMEKEDDYEERLRSFHREHLERVYAFEENGKKVYHRYEAIADRVPQDYYDWLVEVTVANEIRELREKAEIVIDEAQFAPSP